MRINRIDSFRTAAILAVICIHTKPFLIPDSPSLPYKLSGILINQGGRFAVPFFLIISGYLFGCKLIQGVDPIELGKRYSSKILPIFFFWDFVYLLSPALTDDVLKYGVLRPIYWNARNLIRNPLDLVFQGTKLHLWFMVSLLLALWSLAFMVHLNVRLRNVFAFSFALYCLGLLGGSYATTPIGINLHFNTRNFIFLSMLCVAIGWALSQHHVKFNYRFAVILIGFGFAAHMAEAYFLWKYWQVDPTKNDYLIGTIFFATGVAILSLIKTKNDTETIFSRFGRYTLGIYGGHYVFVDMLEPVRHYMPIGLWQIVFPVLVYALSLTAAIALSRTRFRQFVA